MMDERVCDERHERIDARLDGHDETLRVHGDKINVLETCQAKSEVNIENICKNMASLTKAIWFFGTTVFGALVAFLFAQLGK